MGLNKEGKMKKQQKSTLILVIAIFLVLTSCQKEQVWKPGMPLPKEQVKIGVIHISNPFQETAGYSFAHQMGIEEMKQSLDLGDNQILYRVDMAESDLIGVENAMREFIALGVNIIFATSWGYMDICEKLAREHPSVIFAHTSGYKHNDTNFTNYFGRVYQARYLSGIVAGAQTKSGKIGYVAAWGKENSEVASGINAFALGVEKVNPEATVHVMITHSWFDPIGEAAAARALIAGNCDVITQHCDTANPQIEAEKAGKWGIGYNTDMSLDAPSAVLTSVIWHWGTYYTALVQSAINGTFNTAPWYGSLKDGIVDITPLNDKIIWQPENLRLLEDERRRIESGEKRVFGGVMFTNDGRSIGKQDEILSDDTVRNGINWYYRNVVEH
jgi:basic membrane protein A